jgi:hypothetical protein
MRYASLIRWGLILCMLLAGLATAQSSDAHAVTINIPTVLRLSLADHPSASAQIQHIPLQVEVAGGHYRITPNSSALMVFANSSWQLSASYAGDELALMGQLGERLARLRSYPQALASGGVTGGWQTLIVHYALGQLPAAGRYQGLVTYTLAQP